MKTQSQRLVVMSALAIPLALLTIGFVWLVGNVAVTHAQGDTIYVANTGVDDSTCGAAANPCRTIPYAVAMAVAGDVVFVQPGTYLEQVTMKAGVVISGTTAANTIIDGQDLLGPMVSASGAAIGNSAVLRGFTIQRGAAPDGAGLSIRLGSSPTIEDCIVRDNHATSTGGGILVEDSSPLISETRVTDNTAANGGGIYVDVPLGLSGVRLDNNSATSRGGGLYAGGAPTLTDCEVADNTAGADGGGLYVAGGLTILNGTQVSGNTATLGGGLYTRSAILTQTEVSGNSAGSGGGLYQYGTTHQVQATDCLFEGNTAIDFGGGLRANGSAILEETQFIDNSARFGAGSSVHSATVDRCQYSGNHATERGGGLIALDDLLATNNLFYDNTAPEGAEINLRGSASTQYTLRHLTLSSTSFSSQAALYVYSGTVTINNTIFTNHSVGLRQVGGTVTEDYNLFYGNTTHINRTGGTLYSGGHSLRDMNPRFVNPSMGDFHIDAYSPAIDAGIDVGVTEDMDGDPRVAPPDIGADEFFVPNDPPVADAGEPQTVHAGTVTLDGSGSSDPDGDDLDFQWTQTGGAAVTLSDANVASPTFTAPTIAGVLTFDLTVADPSGLDATDTTTVTVTNSAPTADAGLDQQALPAAAVTLHGSGSSDPDGDALLYHWVQTGGLTVALSNPNVASPTFTAPATEGALTFELTVTDPFGVSDLDTTTVNVTTDNVAPIADAGEAQTVHAGTVTLHGSGSSDPDGDALEYHWVQTGGTAVTLSNPNVASPTFTAPTVVGALAFQLTVTDPSGLDDSDTTTVTVANAAPNADAGPDQRTLRNTLVTLNGSGSSDPDGDTLLYYWVQTGGSPTVTLSNPNVANPTFTAPATSGVLTFQLTVIDPFGLNDADSTTVTVSLPVRILLPVVMRGG